MKEEPNSLSPLISQISELLNKIQHTKNPIGPITPEILEKLEELEKAMEAIETINDMAIKDSNIDIEKLAAEIKKSPISLKDRRLLDRAKAIESDARYLHLSLSKAISRGQGQESSDATEEAKKKKIKTRQKRFRRLGGDGWLKT